jgi:hypothetical protein
MKANTIATAVAFGALVAIPAAAAGPYQYHAVTPCRAFDSRIDLDGSTMMQRGINHLRIKGAPCGIPLTAKAATLNITVITPQRAGHITLWPDDGSEPVVSTLNYLQGEPALANGAIVPLRATVTTGECPLKTPSDAPDGDCDLTLRYVRNPPDGVDAGHLAVDVTGYFE